ncbi:hypothetical protein JCM11641_004370 [Rhodosporidiobolus odoratus]
MSTPTFYPPVPFSLGKPPQLADLSPQSLSTFLLAFELYFDLKDVTSSPKKVLMIGLSVTGVTESNAWWSGSMTAHLAKTYEQFVKDLVQEALPRDYVWEVEREIRETISTAAMANLELVKNLLYGMDDELARYLRQHEALLGTGYHEDDRDAIGLGAATPTLAEGTGTDAAAANVAVRAVDYTKFDRVARDHWSVIASRRADVARQVGTAKKLSTATPGLHVPLPPGFIPAADSYAPAPTTNTASTPAEKVATGLRGFSLLEDVEDEGVTLDWSTDDKDDEYVELHLPSLLIRVGNASSASKVGEALADSGCSSIYVSDRMVEELGLEKQKLERPRVAKLAIKGVGGSVPRHHSLRLRAVID